MSIPEEPFSYPSYDNGEPQLTDETVAGLFEELSGMLPEGIGADNPRHILQTIKDHIERKNETIRSLEHERDHDPLTGLYNRRGFYSAAARLLPTLTDNEVLVVSYGDMDNFKPINDRFGHAVGDELLENIAAGLKACVGPKDIVSRFGGDEFVALHVIEAVDAEAASGLKQCIEKAVKEVSDMPEAKWSQMGVDMSVMQSTEYRAAYASMYAVENMLRDADELMYREKRDRKERHVRSSPS